MAHLRPGELESLILMALAQLCKRLTHIQEVKYLHYMSMQLMVLFQVVVKYIMRDKYKSCAENDIYDIL